jgi:hypothetical protein
MFRRYGQIDQDPELNAYDDDLAGFDEEGRDSATDNEGAPVQAKRLNAQPEEEEEEEDEWYLPGAASPDNQDAEPIEGAREQITERLPETSPRTRAATRRGRTSPSRALASKRRRKVDSPFTFPRSRLRLTMYRFRRKRSRFWRNLSLRTSMRPYEVLRLVTSLPRDLILPPSAPNNLIPQQQQLKHPNLRPVGRIEESQEHDQSRGLYHHAERALIRDRPTHMIPCLLLQRP